MHANVTEAGPADLESTLRVERAAFARAEEADVGAAGWAHGCFGLLRETGLREVRGRDGRPRPAVIETAVASQAELAKARAEKIKAGIAAGMQRSEAAASAAGNP